MAKLEKTGMQVGLNEKSKRAVGSLLVGYMQKTEQFQFVDKTFLALFGSLGNGTQSTYILAKERDDYIRFTVFYAV